VRTPVPMTRAARLGLLVALSVLAALTVSVGLLTIAQAGRVLPGTVVAGVDIGGRDAWSARRLVGPALEREQQRPLAVAVPGERIVVRPGDIGLHLDVEATVRAALARGRSGAGAPLVRLSAPLRPVSIAPRGHVDDAVLSAWIDDIATRIEREASIGGLDVDAAARTVTVSGPHGGVRVDREASLRRVRAALLDPDVTRVALAVEVTLPPPTRAGLDALAERVRNALAAPIVLDHEGRRLTVGPETLAELVTVRASVSPQGVAAQLVIPAQRVQQLLGQQGRDTFNRAALDAVILTPDAAPASLVDLGTTAFRPVPIEASVVPGETQVTFVARRIARQLTAMILEGERRDEADLLIVEPSLTTRDALAGRPTHLLATFTTFHPEGSARTVNIRLLADLLDDVLVRPGEEFSVNMTSGPRRCDDGFVPAGTIIRGELVDTCGGGVSQFGTTLMNAAFFAGLPLEQWQAHSFFISRYPAGREATLSYPDLDVRFVNATDGFLIIRTAHTPDSITVSLYGVPAWSEVRAEHGERRAPTDFTEVVRVAPDLRPGARRVVQSGGGGFTITVTRSLVPLDEAATPTIERWTTVYRPQQRIVEVGASNPPVSSDVAPDAAAPPAADAGGSDG
jgi:vancomycin resistance protein YoaR